MFNSAEISRLPARRLAVWSLFGARAPRRNAADTLHLAIERTPESAPVGYPAVQALRHEYACRLRALRRLAAAGVAAPPPDDGDLLELGRAVAGLLPADMRAALLQALWRARASGRGLRIVLEVAPAARAALGIPWELLALPIGWGVPGGPGHDDFLLLSPDITLTRQVRGLGRAPDRALAQPLRLQAFAAAPPDAQSIDLEAARAALAPGDWYAGSGTLSALHERASAGAPEIVHLLCHGEQADTGRGAPRSRLLLTHADGRAERVDARDLARVLVASPALRLVLLQACHSGSVGLGDGTAVESAALTLLQYGVPAVVAMQGEVGQAEANEFARACYRLLGRGETIDCAVAAGRVAMRAAGGIADWSLPVLYAGAPTPRRATYRRLFGT